MIKVIYILKFSYPNTLQKVTEGYIQSAVKLEFGARAISVLAKKGL